MESVMQEKKAAYRALWAAKAPEAQIKAASLEWALATHDFRYQRLLREVQALAAHGHSVWWKLLANGCEPSTRLFNATMKRKARPAFEADLTEIHDWYIKQRDYLRSL